MNDRGLHITKIKIIRAIVSAVIIYFLVTYTLLGTIPPLSIINLVEFTFLLIFVSIMFIGHGSISAFFQRSENREMPPFLVKTVEFVVNLVYILLLNFIFFHFPMQLLYPDDIVSADVLRLVYGIHLLVGFTHYYLLERERSQQKLSKIQLEAETLAKENFEARLLMLKKHLNPQFLYRSLTKLKQFVKEDKQKASRYLRRLSEIYRIFLHQVDQNTVSLQEERTLLESYAQLLEMEYGSQVEIINHIPERENSFLLPSGLCQVILEDWVSCLSNSERLKLRIELQINNQALMLSGKFNQAFSPQQEETIRHIRKTYELQTQNACTPEITEGVDFSVFLLPLFQVAISGPSESLAKYENLQG